MAITFLPSEFSAELIPPRLIEKMISGRLTVNKAALRAVSKLGPLSNKELQAIVLNVKNQYEERAAKLEDSGMDASDANDEALNDKRLLVQRVTNAVTQEVGNRVKSKYKGSEYTWLPSAAETPDPLHQLNYGKTFVLGEGDDNGEDPGDRFGCQCGMRIHTVDEELDLFDE